MQHHANDDRKVKCIVMKFLRFTNFHFIKQCEWMLRPVCCFLVPRLLFLIARKLCFIGNTLYGISFYLLMIHIWFLIAFEAKNMKTKKQREKDKIYHTVRYACSVNHSRGKTPMHTNNNLIASVKLMMIFCGLVIRNIFITNGYNFRHIAWCKRTIDRCTSGVNYNAIVKHDSSVFLLHSI